MAFLVAFWAIVFVAALALVLKGADWFLERAEKIGLGLGFSPFIIGVVLVGLGTSFPEVASALAAVWQGATEIVVANAVGSNIANILLVVGIAVVIGKQLTVTKNLIDLDLPLLAIATTVFLGVVIDGQVSVLESVLLLLLFVIFMAYTASGAKEVIPEEGSVVEPVPQEGSPGWRVYAKTQMTRALSIQPADFGMLIVGLIALVVGAHFFIQAIIALAQLLGVGVGPISLVAVAIGTSLPELLVSAKAAMQGKAEVALGNIFGSNVFNILLVVGLPGVFGTLAIDSDTLTVGVPIMVAATVLFIISGISKQIYRYEGAMYLVLYLFFLGQLTGLL